MKKLILTAACLLGAAGAQTFPTAAQLEPSRTANFEEVRRIYNAMVDADFNPSIGVCEVLTRDARLVNASLGLQEKSLVKTLDALANATEAERLRHRSIRALLTASSALMNVVGESCGRRDMTSAAQASLIFTLAMDLSVLQWTRAGKS